VRRRQFITLLGGAVGMWPLGARARQQTTKVPRVGWLATGSPTSYRFSLAAFSRPNASKHDVRLIIGVEVSVSQNRLYNTAFLGD
jgi:hypothetical protein